MNKFLIVGLLLFGGFYLTAQSSAEKEQVIAPIKQLFEGMAQKDSMMLKEVFYETARLATTATDKEGKPQFKIDDVAKFISSIGSFPKERSLEERILSYEVKVDDNLAIVWTPYEFYVDEKFSHCGVNAFELFKTVDGWKITSIIDTRRREGCQDK